MSFLVNVLASVAGAVIFWVVTRYLQPALHQLLWNGTQVAGRWDFWDADPSLGGKPVGSVVLQQRARVITGVATRHTNRTGTPTSREYRYAGQLSARELIMTFHASDRPDYIRGALVLHLDNSGRVLSGKTVYYDEEAATVTPHPIWYTRESA